MSIADLDRLNAVSAQPIEFVIGGADGAVMAMESAFPAAEGVIPALSHCRICLSVGQVTSLRYRDGVGGLEGMWRSGQFTVSMPGTPAEMRVGSMRAVGLAINLDGVADPDDLLAASQRFNRDPLIASLLVTLRHEAEIHGASSAFFGHGVTLIMSRLAALNGRPSRRLTDRRLAESKRRKVIDLMHHAIGADLSIGMMADHIGMSRTAFSQAWHATTGYTPYAYLTRVRMTYARSLLSAGRSVTETSLMVGYRNPAKFADAFRRVHGLSPSRARF